MNPKNEGCDSGSDDYHSTRQAPPEWFVVCLLSKSKASDEREISSATDANPFRVLGSGEGFRLKSENLSTGRRKQIERV